MNATEELIDGDLAEDDTQWAHTEWLQTAKNACIEVVGGVFADDAQWLAYSKRGLEVAVRTSEDFLGFHGGQFNADKSTYRMFAWRDESDGAGVKYDEIDGEVWVDMLEPNADGSSRRLQLKRISAEDEEKYLGVVTTGCVWWGAAEDTAREQVRHVAGRCNVVKARQYGRVSPR